MKYDVFYSIVCNIGKIRNVNQDNFWCDNKYLEAINSGLKSVVKGEISVDENPTFAVFDGMGGEQYGEIAAHLATMTFDKNYKASKFSDIKKFHYETCKLMNDEIVNFADKNQINHMGTTAAIITFSRDRVYICNIGDSKIYRFYKNKLIQISEDHIVGDLNKRKPPLSQYLGISEVEFLIEPHIANEIIKKGDRYLLCSDGLTDMLSEKEIKYILSKNQDVQACLEKLLEIALEKGGRDNITIILCQLNKRNIKVFDKLFKIKIY